MYHYDIVKTARISSKQIKTRINNIKTKNQLNTHNSSIIGSVNKYLIVHIDFK